MKLLNINEKEGTFKVQSNKFIGYNKFKCHFPEEGFDHNDEWWFPLNKKHTTTLPKLLFENRAHGAYGKFRDDPNNTDPHYDLLILDFTFTVNGISFRVFYDINIVSGEVAFRFSDITVIKEDFVASDDMPIKLCNMIKNEMNNKWELIGFWDNEQGRSKLFKYVIKKYLKQMKDYVNYLESLNEDLCEDCVYKYKYRLSPSKECKELYLKNKF